MADVTDLDERRHARAARTAAAAPLHPAVRFVAGDCWWLAHRRHPDDAVALCGLDGDLVLAPPGVPLCPLCYPVPAARPGP